MRVVGHLPLPPQLVQIGVMHKDQGVVAAVYGVEHQSADAAMAASVGIVVLALPKFCRLVVEQLRYGL